MMWEIRLDQEPRLYVVAAQAASAEAETARIPSRSGSPLAEPGLEDSGYLSRVKNRADGPPARPRAYGKLSGVGSRAASIVLVSIAVFLAGCGSHTHSAAPAASTVTTAFKGSPPPLAALHAQANQVLSGGPPAFKARLEELRGYPVVVNKWASWCGPCKSEFPAFQKAAVDFGRRVAFVGVNGHGDTTSEATSFLKQFPVTYPSYEDPNESIARTIQAVQFDPMTVFLDRQGKVAFVHAGAYPNTAALVHDIRFYALSNGK
jgi:cytochrome c biogenesis protein CcmG, thiol:disulfide interchange protein DsbE